MKAWQGREVRTGWKARGGGPQGDWRRPQTPERSAGAYVVAHNTVGGYGRLETMCTSADKSRNGVKSAAGSVRGWRPRRAKRETLANADTGMVQ